ncbi:MAG: hypothetical protein ACOZAQ_02985 [Pseudomonadota bacterium]
MAMPAQQKDHADDIDEPVDPQSREQDKEPEGAPSHSEEKSFPADQISLGHEQPGGPTKSNVILY